jgi:O-methyltransferase
MQLLRTLFNRTPSNALKIRFELLRQVGRIFLPGYRFKWPQLDWWEDPMFNAFLSKFSEMKGMNTDRRWMQYQLMRLVKSVPGDTAECGAYMGAASYMICKANEDNSLHQRTHHVFDSFEGLSAPRDCDGAHWTQGDLTCPLETVRTNLSEFHKVCFHKGWIPKRFPEVADAKFCFVHIDVDLYGPSLDSIAFFYPRMNEGGVIICDDYGFSSCPGATKAIDEYLQDQKEEMVSLSGGGGFLIKGTETSKPLNVDSAARPTKDSEGS